MMRHAAIAILVAFALLVFLQSVTAIIYPTCELHKDGEQLHYPTHLIVLAPEPPGSKYEQVYELGNGLGGHARRQTCPGGTKDALAILLSADVTAHSVEGETKGPGNVWRLTIKPGENGAPQKIVYFNLKHGATCFVCFDYDPNATVTAMDVSRDM